MAQNNRSASHLDEMCIVDVFTKLIFDSSSELDASENHIIELLCQAEASMEGASRRDVSDYLRSVGVDDMIKLVLKVKRQEGRNMNLVDSPRDANGIPIHH